MRLPLMALVCAALFALCDAHGHMTLPASRNGGTLEKAGDCFHGECMWFSQPDADYVHKTDRTARIPGEPTLNAPSLRTYNINTSSGPLDYTRTSPWRAPGSAAVFGSGCGRAGGGPLRQMDGGTAKEFGLIQNMDGSALPPLESEAPIWKLGSVQEVAWANNANHGGGYAYRLCKSEPGAKITEQCFQAGHLDFAGDTQWLQTWRVGPNQNRTSFRVAIPRVTVQTGTVPEGSQWARVPIPACRFTGAHFNWPDCKGDCAACCHDPKMVPLPAHPRINESWWRAQDCVAGCAGNGLPGSCPAGDLQFPEPTPGMSGLWSTWRWCGVPQNDTSGLGDSPGSSCSNATMIATNIVDRVSVPEHLEPGHYLLSWRWDCEQTNQIWQNCADVTIAA